MSGVKFGKCAITQCSNHHVSHNVPLRKIMVGQGMPSNQAVDSMAQVQQELWVCTSCYKGVSEPKMQGFSIGGKVGST